MVALAHRIDSLDVTVFDAIDAQLSVADRRSLLALHSAWRNIYGDFDYLEIGSHLGGSLQVLIQDPACRSIVSIDPRPAAQPDERGMEWEYLDNSTARMIDLLGKLDRADTEKLTTLDVSTESLIVDQLPVSPSACFVDGEHTNGAVLRDARFCLQAARESACIVFHDANIVYEALVEFQRELADSTPWRSYFLADCIFVIEIGPSRLIDSTVLQQELFGNAAGYLWSLSRTSPYRDWFRRSLHYQTLDLRLAKLRRLVRRGRLLPPR